MKKIVILLILILVGTLVPSFADNEEIIEDYMDMASHNSLLGDYEDAVKYLDKIIRLAPNDEEYPKLKSLLYQLGTKNQKSFITGYIADLDKSMSARRIGDNINEGNILQDSTKNNSNFWIYHYLGEYFRENKEYNAAIECYFKAYQIEPAFTQALLAIAICYLESERYEMVNEPIKRFLYYNQQCDLAYAIRAKAFMKLEQYSDAETEIVTAIALNDDIEYELIHGIILYKRGSYARAINVLNKVAEEVQTSDVFKYLGLCYLAKKEYSNAMLNLDKAILLSDDDKELIEKYNETRELIKDINTIKLQNEERNEVKEIYTQQYDKNVQSEALENEENKSKKSKKREKK